MTNKDYAWRVVPKTNSGAAAPHVATVAPGSGTHLGGGPINVLGTGFQAGPIVRVGGALATSVVRVNAGLITCSAPPGAIGARDVVVLNEDGKDSGTSGNGKYTYT